MYNTKIESLKRAIDFQRDNGNHKLADILATELQYQIDKCPTSWVCGSEEEEEEEELVNEVV